MKTHLRILDRLGILQLFNFTTSIKINNKRIKIPLIRSIGKDNLIRLETWMCELFEKLLKLKKGDFIDIGINIGQTLIKLKSVSNEVRYFGFEPNPTCIFYVQELVKANNFTNSFLYPVAIGEKTELSELNFFDQVETDSGASILPKFRSHQKIVRKAVIPCFKFDDISFSGLDNIAIIKIDVEGAELEVMKGSLSLIEKHRPFILIEILPVYFELNGDRMQRQSMIESIIFSLKYQIFRVYKKKNKQFDKLEMVQTIGIHSEIEWSDYVLCPNEHVASLPL